MEVIYSGKEVMRLLNEGIPGYKPIIGGNASNENKKINDESNKDSIKKTSVLKPKQDSSPVIGNKNQSSDIGNNKNMLDIQFDVDPGSEYKDRVKKQVIGDKVNGEVNASNKAFYNAAKKASDNFTSNKQKVSNSGLTGKEMSVDKKNTPFNESTKTKRLNFKNTRFLNEKHMLSLIPENYKKNGNSFIMKDKINNEYLVEWRLDVKSMVSEGIVLGYKNKDKTKSDFDKIKKLYEYNSTKHSGRLTNANRVSENTQVLSGLKRLRDISDN